MLHYLINLSCIWLLCLIVFDVFLKRESYHGYNRIYLNLSILLGILLPLWSWQGDSIIYASDISKTVADQASVIKEQVVASTSASVVSWETWLLWLYLAGVGISTSLLIKELVVIIKLIKTGHRSKSGVWTIIETNKATSPFSAFRYIFICSLDNYTEEELSIILAHEKQHGHLLHFIDLLFVNLVKIVFWFHPFIYLLEKRLLMVHEYQADQVIETQPSDYGQFLIEQSMLQTAPTLSHSFIRSPLKKRIMMLTKRSGKLASGKKLFLIPLILTATICFTQLNTVFGQRVVDGNIITYNGNKFEKQTSETDTVWVDDPVSGETIMVHTTREGAIIKVNGENIISKYYHSPSQPTQIINAINKAKAEIGNKIQTEILQMQKNEELQSTTFNYNIGQIVIDENGYVIYYEVQKEYYNIKPSNDFKTPSKRIDIPKAITDKINQKIIAVLQDLKADIMYKDGEPTPYVFHLSDSFYLE